MYLLVPLALIGWIPLVIVLFASMPPKFATAISFAAGWCFLPVAGFSLPGLPDYTKMFATSVGTLIGLGLFHPQVFTSFRPSWIDIPAVVFCLCPMASSLTNDLGAYDGASAMMNNIVSWGLPYFIGRFVYRTPHDLVPLAYAVVVCGLLYVPFCLWEARMSPQLHLQVYGFRQHAFGQTMRFGGWRPMVFMQHGLQVALWMGSCVIIAFATWYCAGLQTARRVPLWMIVGVLMVTFALLKSLGAYLLVAGALGLLVAAKYLRSSWPLLLTSFAVVAFLALRAPGIYSGQGLVDVIASTVSPARAKSLAFRLENEDLLADKAWQRPLFGWGGWNRNRVYDANGKDISITDGLWIITFGVNGLTGLVSLYALLLTGPTLVMIRSKPSEWRRQPPLGIAAGIAMACAINAIDSLPNAMIAPVFVMSTGALVSVGIQMGKSPTRVRSSSKSFRSSSGGQPA